MFEEECIGYRFVNKIIVPITDKNEILSIEEASKTAYNNVNEHIDLAIYYLRSKENRDYKKVISESLMALESLLKNFCDKNDDTLTSMLKKIDSKKNIHPHLKEAMQKLYWFASDESGIRHENNKERNSLTFDEAKFVLVTITALINYMIPILKEN